MTSKEYLLYIIEKRLKLKQSFPLRRLSATKLLYQKKFKELTKKVVIAKTYNMHISHRKFLFREFMERLKKVLLKE